MTTGHIVKGHIVKASNLIRELGVEEPILGYSYVRIEHIPEHLQYLLRLDKEEVSSTEDLRPLVDLATAVAGVMAAGRDRANISQKIIVKEGSLIVIVAVMGILVNIFREEVRELLKKLYEDPRATAEQVHELYEMILKDIAIRNSRIRVQTKALRDGTLDVLGLAPQDVIAQGRSGTPANLEKFLRYLTASRNRARDEEERLEKIKQAVTQYISLYESVDSPLDKGFLFRLLSIRLRGKIEMTAELEVSIEYNKQTDALKEILKALKEDVDGDGDGDGDGDRGGF